jgi:hypothetical protein
LSEYDYFYILNFNLVNFLSGYGSDDDEKKVGDDPPPNSTDARSNHAATTANSTEEVTATRNPLLLGLPVCNARVLSQFRSRCFTRSFCVATKTFWTKESSE